MYIPEPLKCHKIDLDSYLFCQQAGTRLSLADKDLRWKISAQHNSMWVWEFSNKHKLWPKQLKQLYELDIPKALLGNW